MSTVRCIVCKWLDMNSCAEQYFYFCNFWSGAVKNIPNLSIYSNCQSILTTTIRAHPQRLTQLCACFAGCQSVCKGPISMA